MKEVLGFWLISLAIIISIVSIEHTFDFKEKVKMVFGTMAVLTLIIVGVCLMGV